MSELVINLLGLPSIVLNQQPLDAQTSKATALMAYLAVNNQAHTRIELASLLWTDLDKDKALAALRTTLWKLKKAGVAKWLKVSRGSVFLAVDDSIEIDVIRFNELITQCESHGHHPSKVCPACLRPLADAANLYHGDFMKGFSLRDAGEFDNWQSLNNEILRQDILQILAKLVKGHQSQGEINRAIHFARRWINFDQYNEDVYRQLMGLLVSSGQRAEALQLYRKLAKMLSKESMEPQTETTQLYYRIHTEKLESINNSQQLETPVFLITDIENADVMWANYHDQMVQTVSRLNSIVKDCASQYGGYIVKQSGDTTTLYFDKGQPLHCTLAIHNRLMRTTWTVNTLPRIRIALNAAEYRQPNIEDYATDIYRLQRLLSTGWGGQVLLTTQVLNTVELPPKATVRDLGMHVLKDLGEPLRIYRLIHPDLPSREYPPLQSLSNFRQNLPNFPTVFIDREMEQIDLANLLSNENCRLLTLVGPGGVGKTRLALQVAAQQINNFTDGVYFVPVITPKTPDLIPSVIAQTFKFTFFEQKDPLELVIDFLREKNMLLIVDNFEHLTKGADVLSKLLGSAPGLKMVVTSRERLNLHEEWIYEVNGMSFPTAESSSSDSMEQYSAVQLFIQNSRRLLTGFTPTADDLTAIIQICQTVDGIPLAIELATAWIRTLSCQEIAKEIQQNIDFLNTMMRDIPARHRSLRAVFEHSWNLLSEEGRRTFRKLAVFRGGFTSDAASQITNASPIILASFIDRSLLRRASDGRFEVIEVLRHFAELKLQESDVDFNRTCSLYSDYYCELMHSNFPAMMGPDMARIVDSLQHEFENFSAAWQWAVDSEKWENIEKSLYGFFSFLEDTGLYSDGIQMLSTALTKLNSSKDQSVEWLKANIKRSLAWSEFCIGDHVIGMQRMKEALDDFIRLNSHLDIGISYYFLAKANERLNFPELAVEQAEKCLEYCKDETGVDQRVLHTLTAQTLEVYGLALLKVDRVKEAKKVLKESLQISQKLNQKYGSAQIQDALGKVLMVEGDYNGAYASCTKALQVARDFDNRYSIAILLNNLAHLCTMLDDPEKALRYQQESIQTSQEIGYRWLTAIGLNNLAFLYLKSFSNFDEAIRLYEESLSLFEDIGDHRGVIFTLHDIGLAVLEVEQFKSSSNYFLDALRRAHQLNTPELQLYILSSFASLYFHQGDLDQASKLCRLVHSHPKSGSDAKQRVIKLMEDIEKELSASQIEEYTHQGEPTTLEEIVADLLIPA